MTNGCCKKKPDRLQDAQRAIQLVRENSKQWNIDTAG